MGKKILHVLNTSKYGGAENVAITIINRLKDKYECAYVSLDGSIANILEQYDIKCYLVRKLSVYQLKLIVNKFKPDIIHAHDFTSGIVCALTGQRIKVISHLHHNPPWLGTYHFYSFIYLLSSIKYRNILIVSSSIIDKYVFRDFIKSKVQLISNPCDIAKIRMLAKNNEYNDVMRYDIAYLGRFSEEKNPMLFIEIVSHLVAKYPSLKAVMIGDGPIKEKCVQYIDSLNVKINFTLTGFLHNPYIILNSSKMLLVTSKWEGFGLAVFEALSLGLPVVSNTIEGLKGILDDECGKLTSSKNEIINEVDMLMNNENYYLKKSNNAKKRAESISNIDKYINGISNIYINI